jgi:hypothetical protein
MSWRTELYESAAAAAQGVLAGSMLQAHGLQAVRHAAPYFQQYLVEEENPPFACPAVFIDIESVSWQNIGRGSQQGVAELAVHLVQHTLASTARDAAAAADRKLLLYPLILHAALADLEGLHFGKLMRVSEDSMRKDMSYYAIVIRYRCSVRDNMPNRLLAAPEGRPDTSLIVKSQDIFS